MNIQAEFIDKAGEMGVKVSRPQAERFQVYLQLLLEWNEKMNLTAITEPHEVVIKHFVDSLCLLKVVDIRDGAKVIDVGTGAGFPGVPLKIMRPDIQLTLLDGLNKRLKFLAALGEALDFKAEYIHKRAEEAGKIVGMRECYDLVTARAVARMSTLCEYCIPLVKMKGKFAALKGPGLRQELDEAKSAMDILGCHEISIESFILPDAEKSERSIAILQKTAFTPKAYPRHGNTITKSPL